MDSLPSNEMLNTPRKRILATMSSAVVALAEIEVNLANPIGATPSTRYELEKSKEDFAKQLDTRWSELEQLDKENKG